MVRGVFRVNRQGLGGDAVGGGIPWGGCRLRAKRAHINPLNPIKPINPKSPKALCRARGFRPEVAARPWGPLDLGAEHADWEAEGLGFRV